MRDHRGFTLVEILVALVIISVMAGTAAYVLNGTEQHRLKAEASDLATLLNHLADRALMKQQTLGWQYNAQPNRCRILQFGRDGEWRSTDIGKRPCTFNTVAQLEATYPGSVAAHSHQDDDIPDLVFYPSGEYAPFTLELRSRADLGLRLTGDGINTIVLEPVTP